MAKRKKPIYFEDVAERTLRLIDGTLSDLERLRKTRRRQERKAIEDGEEELCPVDVVGLNALDKTTRALSGLLSQLRAIAKDNREKMGNIGPSDRLKLILDYFATLPEEQMYSLLLDCKAIYEDRRGRKQGDPRLSSPKGEPRH